MNKVEFEQAYQIARDMMHIDKFSAVQTKAALIDFGIDEQAASAITDIVAQELTDKVINKSFLNTSTKVLLFSLLMLIVVSYFWLDSHSEPTPNPLTVEFLKSSPYYTSPKDIFLSIVGVILASVLLILRFRK